MRSLVLASASPRRRRLLTQLGLSFQVMESDVDEAGVLARGGSPEALARSLALQKSAAVARRLAGGEIPMEVPAGSRIRWGDDAVVLGADTVVVIDGEVLGKPRDADEAVAMLTRLQGRTHTVVTGVAVVDAGDGRHAAVAEVTRVTMRPLAPAQVRAYVAGGEPLDKAGAYAIQGLGAVLVTRVEGCFFNVVGLPLARTADLLSDFGIEVLVGHGAQGSHPKGTAGR